MDRTLGTDILVPPAACDALLRLARTGILEITDAGLALDGKPRQQIELDLGHPSEIGCLRKAPSLTRARSSSRSSTTASASPTTAFARRQSDADRAFSRSVDGRRARGRMAAVDELLGGAGQKRTSTSCSAEYPDDEERVYRALGSDRHDGRSASAAACGGQPRHPHYWTRPPGTIGEPSKQELASRPIIAVQLPTQAAENRSDAWMPLSLKRALDWILVKADELSAEITGERDGCRLSSIAALAAWPGRRTAGAMSSAASRSSSGHTGRAGRQKLCTVVMSAGNSLAIPRRRPCSTIDKERVSLPWRVLPDDKTPSFVQIWLPETD